MNSRLMMLVAFVVLMASGRTSAQKTATGKLTADDYVEIQQLYGKFNHAIDWDNGEAFAANFTPDGVFDKAVGHDGLVQYALERTKRSPAGKTRHWNSVIVITPTAEGASGSCYWQLWDTSVKPPAASSSGRYEDAFVKTAQGWRFKKRITLSDAVPTPATQ